MVAEMTPGSNHSLVISRKGIERRLQYTQPKHRSDKSCHFSQLKLKDQKPTKSTCIRSLVKFCFKDRARMEHMEPPVDPNAEGTERTVKDMTLKWFIDTQVPFIVNNGLLPTWFLGFITRKDAEEKLREKELGCFLIRLSNKAIGYILSYKGRDRCRHFVINQSETGQFVVYGDTEGHYTMPELIEYYKTSPIEPFGEYLTSSCFEAPNEELYDIIMISPKEKHATAAKALKNTQECNSTPEQQHTRPPKSNKTVEEVPPLPRRSRHPDSGLLNDHVVYAQLRKRSPRGSPRAQHTTQDDLPGAKSDRGERSNARGEKLGRCRPLSEPDSVYSELNLLDNRGRSLSPMDHSSDWELSHRLGVPPSTPPRLSPKPARLVSSCVPRSEKPEFSSSHNLDYMSDDTVYHLAGRPGSPHTTPFDARSSPEQDCDSVYAEVPCETPTSCIPADQTYELIPASKETAKPKLNSNTYEPLEDLRRKHNYSSWGLKNDKWKWLFPEAKRKW